MGRLYKQAARLRDCKFAKSLSISLVRTEHKEKRGLRISSIVCMLDCAQVKRATASPAQCSCY